MKFDPPSQASAQSCIINPLHWNFFMSDKYDRKNPKKIFSFIFLEQSDSSNCRYAHLNLQWSLINLSTKPKWEERPYRDTMCLCLCDCSSESKSIDVFVRLLAFLLSLCILNRLDWMLNKDLMINDSTIPIKIKMCE